MNLDDCLNVYFENGERYADLLNGSIFKGEQIIRAKDLQSMDTKMPKPDAKTRQRDNLRRVIFGTRFAVVSLENQNKVDYKMPLRCMDYDIREYERQAREIGRRNKKRVRGADKISGEEYLSEFRKVDKLYPCATIVLFFGENWDGNQSLHEMIDFTDIPKTVRKYIQDYRINLIQVRQLENLDWYQSDLRQVFEVVRYAEDRNMMKEILAKDESYQHMEGDAADLIAELVHMPEIRKKKEEKRKGKKVNMCKAIYEMIEEGREEGREEGKETALITAIHNLMKNLNKTAEAAMELLGIPLEERGGYLEKL